MLLTPEDMAVRKSHNGYLNIKNGGKTTRQAKTYSYFYVFMMKLEEKQLRKNLD